MKHLLNGVAIAATLAIAASAWAQAPMTPDAGKKASGGAGRDVGRVAPAAPAAAAPAAAAAPMHAQRHHRTAMHHMAHHGHMMHMGAGDAATDQLNREELARLQGGGAPMAPPPAPEGGAGQGGPRASGGTSYK